LPTPSRSLIERARRAARFGGLAVLAASAILLSVALGLFPGVTLRPVNGSTTTTQIAALSASGVGVFIGSVFLGYSFRGFDDMTIQNEILTLPIRTLAGMLRGRRRLVPVGAIAEVRLMVSTKGTPFAEFVMKPNRGRRVSLDYATGWSPDFNSFVAALSKAVLVTRVTGWEELWFEWRSAARR